MTTETAFLEAILTDPTGHTDALIYANWLDEQGRWQEALHVRFCAQSRMRPVLSRTGKLGWWDPIMERFLGPGAVGKGWLVGVWSWEPTERQGLYLPPSAREGSSSSCGTATTGRSRSG